MSGAGLTVLIMAGGRGERMLASGVPVTKPLVPVQGVPLLERNLWSIARLGVDRVVVSIARGADPIEACAREAGAALGRASSWPLEVLVEEAPLGNIGCAGALRGRAREVLLLYADNLTLLPLDDLLAHHRESRADLTLATHRQTFRMPFGALDLAHGRVTGYREKPESEYVVSSAVCVLGAAALDRLEGQPAGLADLSAALIGDGNVVVAYEHASPWIDVNDAAGAAAAEAMVRDHRAAFECWAPRVDAARALWIARGPSGFIAGHGEGDGVLPVKECEDREDAAALVARMRTAAGLAAVSETEIVEFDDVTPDGRFVRTYAHIDSDLPHVSPKPPWSWRSEAGVLRQPEAARALARAGLGSS